MKEFPNAIAAICAGLLLADAQLAEAACSGGPSQFTCLSEADFLAKTAELGYTTFTEDFDDDTVWGTVRSLIQVNSARSVTSQGVIWTANFVQNEISTTGGSSTGDWRVFDPDHGSASGAVAECDIDNPPENCLWYDGFTGTRVTGGSVLYAVGGYVNGSVGSNLVAVLDNDLPNQIELGKLLDTTPHFFGVIDTTGFSSFQFVEIDGKIGQKFLIFGDDFTFGVDATGENSAPVADAGADQTALVGDTVTLDGSGSSDVDGNALSFQWSLISAPVGSTATLSDATTIAPSFTVDVFGDYVAQLIVNDGSLDSLADTVTISTENSPPVADAGADQTALVGDTVSLDGSGSSDVDGNALSFQWSLISAPVGSTATLSDATTIAPSFTVDVFGDYVAQLIVNDGSLDSLADTVTISTENSPPVADAGADQTALVGDTVSLDGSGSSDVDGNALSFQWSLISAPVGSTATLSDATTIAPSFTVDVFGDYVAQLIVNDGSLDSLADTVTISTENSPPVADAGADQTALVGDTVSLDGSGSSDVDGNALSFQWSLTTVPTGSAAVLSDPAAVMPTFDVDVFGQYVAQLIVNDGSARQPRRHGHDQHREQRRRWPMPAPIRRLSSVIP